MVRPRSGNKSASEKMTSRQSISRAPDSKELALQVVDYIVRKILTFNVHYKVAVYFAIVTIGGVIGDVSRPEHFYFSRKHSFLNQFFVKLGWGWTLTVVGTLMLLGGLINGLGWRNARWPLCRLLLMTLHWYACTHGFELVEHWSGSCSNLALTSKRPCLKDGHVWFGYDISGHAFLLVHCLLFINEEAQVILALSKSLDQMAKSEQPPSSPPSHLRIYRLQLRIISIALLTFTFLWEFMLVITSLYYHSTIQKWLGMVIALGGWTVVYKVLRLQSHGC